MRGKLLELGWRRHSVVKTDSILGELIKNSLPEEFQELSESASALFVIITYDCAVVSSCFKSEPWLQLLIATPLEQLEKSKVNGRNPRVLHFYLEKDGKEVPYEVNAAGFCQVKRELLYEERPNIDYVIPTKSSEQLKVWVAERFRQETWPDAFNSTFDDKTKKKLKAFYKRYNEYISALYLCLNTYEELPDKGYEVGIILAVEKKKPLIKYVREREKKDFEIEQALNKVRAEIKEIFPNEITIIEDHTNESGYAIEVLSESEITIADQRRFFKFSPHSLSEGEEHPIPVELLPEARS